MGRLEQLVLGVAPRWMIEVASRAKAEGRHKLAARRFGPLVKDMVPQATSHELLVANDDAVVVRVARGADEPVILKIATSDIASEQGRYEAAALEELAQRTSLGQWRSLVAKLHATGTFDDGTWFVQSMLPGIATSRLEVGADELVTEVSLALRPLHTATATHVMADDVVLDDLVTESIEIIRSWRPSVAQGLTAINGECRQRLASLELTLGRQHGDFAPSNVLWDNERETVSGIVDWKLGMQLLPPETDYVHYALSLLMQRRRIEYGDAVILMLNDGAGVVAGSPVRVANELGPNNFDVRTSVTLAWLQHVSFGLQKAHDLRTNPIWLVNNIDNVVRALTVPA